MSSSSSDAEQECNAEPSWLPAARINPASSSHEDGDDAWLKAHRMRILANSYEAALSVSNEARANFLKDISNMQTSLNEETNARQNAQTQLATRDEEINALKASVVTYQQQIEALTATMTRTTSDLGAAEERLDGTSATLASLRRELDTEKRRRARAEQEVERCRQEAEDANRLTDEAREQASKAKHAASRSQRLESVLTSLKGEAEALLAERDGLAAARATTNAELAACHARAQEWETRAKAAEQESRALASRLHDALSRVERWRNAASDAEASAESALTDLKLARQERDEREREASAAEQIARARAVEEARVATERANFLAASLAQLEANYRTGASPGVAAQHAASLAQARGRADEARKARDAAMQVAEAARSEAARARADLQAMRRERGSDGGLAAAERTLREVHRTLADAARACDSVDGSGGDDLDLDDDDNDASDGEISMGPMERLGRRCAERLAHVVTARIAAERQHDDAAAEVQRLREALSDAVGGRKAVDDSALEEATLERELARRHAKDAMCAALFLVRHGAAERRRMRQLARERKLLVCVLGVERSSEMPSTFRYVALVVVACVRLRACSKSTRDASELASHGGSTWTFVARCVGGGTAHMLRGNLPPPATVGRDITDALLWLGSGGGAENALVVGDEGPLASKLDFLVRLLDTLGGVSSFVDESQVEAGLLADVGGGYGGGGGGEVGKSSAQQRLARSDSITRAAFAVANIGDGDCRRW
ncbi:hypothetical protein PPROV_000585900 [Pycnococcus provasolii]|uniref:Uncharacterized protein n=1 Tax=Pycnococcus provasolii TaxID=41880 RepID=A0A830HIF0_9CHLO|nr:hypothetical protein PPROV_000585900 [Pycnococcus provasolii]